MNKISKILEQFFYEAQEVAPDLKGYWNKFKADISKIDGSKELGSGKKALDLVDKYIVLSKDGFKKYGEGFKVPDLSISIYGSDKDGVDLNADKYFYKVSLDKNSPFGLVNYSGSEGKNKREDALSKEEFTQNLYYDNICQISLV